MLFKPSERFWPLVPGAGTGTRAKTRTPKQYVCIGGRSVIEHTVSALSQVPVLEKVIVVLAPDDELFAKYYPNFDGYAAKVGGQTRAASVRSGLSVLRDQGARDHDWVLVHDAARCLLKPEWVDELIRRCQDDEVGGILACPVPDTMKHAIQNRSRKTVNREDMWLAQTPQMFRLKILEQALDAAEQQGLNITDEASSIEALGLKPQLVACSSDNFKLTYPEDFERAELILRARQKSSEGVQEMDKLLKCGLQIRVGEGWDTHQLVEGRPLLLGGVRIPHAKGLLGHSDADVLLHAIIDALLGAIGQGDIGRLFPDTDTAFKDADSAQLLKVAYEKVQALGWELVNVDATITAQTPKLAPYMSQIVTRIAEILGCDAGQINVKAKTAERMGPVGEERSMEARAICLVARAYEKK